MEEVGDRWVRGLWRQRSCSGADAAASRGAESTMEVPAVAPVARERARARTGACSGFHDGAGGFVCLETRRQKGPAPSCTPALSRQPAAQPAPRRASSWARAVLESQNAHPQILGPEERPGTGPPPSHPPPPRAPAPPPSTQDSEAAGPLLEATHLSCNRGHGGHPRDTHALLRPLLVSPRLSKPIPRSSAVFGLLSPFGQFLFSLLATVTCPIRPLPNADRPENPQVPARASAELQIMCLET